MTGEEAGSDFRICPTCGAVLQVRLTDQFFCESCGSPLAEDDPQTALPDWLREGPVAGNAHGTRDRLEPAAAPDSSDQPLPTRIELQPTGAAVGRRSTRPQRTGLSCTLIVGVLVFLAALGMLCWVLFAIVRTRATEPASLLSVCHVITTSVNQPWHYTDVQLRGLRGTSTRSSGWSQSRVVERKGSFNQPGESLGSLPRTLTGPAAISELHVPR